MRPNHTNKKWRQNNYYPFGLQHQGYNDIANSCRNEEAEAYKYNGKEYEDAFGLNIYEMDLRQLDPAIGRWTVMDPVIHHDYSPYSAFDNNPVYWSDPSGADATSFINSLWNKSGSGLTSYTLEDGQIVDTYYDKDAAEAVQNMYELTANSDETGGGGKGNKGSFQPPTAIMKLAREIGMQYGYSISEQDAIISWLKTHAVIEKNGIVTLKGIDGLSININKSDLLIEKSLEAGAAFGSKFALKKLISYGTTKLIGGAFNMTLNTQSLNNYPNQQQKAFEQTQKLALINSAGDKIIQYIFQRSVNVQEPSMLNNMTRIVTPTGISLWQTKYN